VGVFLSHYEAGESSRGTAIHWAARRFFFRYARQPAAGRTVIDEIGVISRLVFGCTPRQAFAPAGIGRACSGFTALVIAFIALPVASVMIPVLSCFEVEPQLLDIRGPCLRCSVTGRWSARTLPRVSRGQEAVYGLCSV
jgi:hypothetical protein